jgi:hypothetical protein
VLADPAFGVSSHCGAGAGELGHYLTVTDNCSQEPVVWHAVQPELTHFHNIIAFDFDVGVDRGTSDTYGPLTLPPGEGKPWPWQRLVLTIAGGPRDEDGRTLRVRCTFEGLVYLRFLQDDVEGSIDQEGDRGLYTISDLRGVAGYNQEHLGDDTSTSGAFCLWESYDSLPLQRLTESAGRFSAIRPGAEGHWLRHFRTSCDELGTFEIVAGNVTIEQIEH